MRLSRLLQVSKGMHGLISLMDKHVSGKKYQVKLRDPSLTCALPEHLRDPVSRS